MAKTKSNTEMQCLVNNFYHSPAKKAGTVSLAHQDISTGYQNYTTLGLTVGLPDGDKGAYWEVRIADANNQTAPVRSYFQRTDGEDDGRAQREFDSLIAVLAGEEHVGNAGAIVEPTGDGKTFSLKKEFVGRKFFANLVRDTNNKTNAEYFKLWNIKEPRAVGVGTSSARDAVRAKYA